MKHVRIITVWCDGCCQPATVCTCNPDNMDWKEIREIIEAPDNVKPDQENPQSLKEDVCILSKRTMEACVKHKGKLLSRVEGIKP